MKRVVCACLLVSVPLGAFPSVAVAQEATDSGRRCNAGASAATGAVFGALVGGLLAGRHNRAGGALIGSAIGGAIGGIGCASMNSRVSQQRTNKQVMQAYQQQLGAARQPVVVSYTSAPAAASFAQNEPVVMTSHMIVAMPSGETQSSIVENFKITTPDGQTKDFSKPISGNGGEMTNDLTLNLPPAMPHGIYQVQSQLVVGEQRLATSTSSFRYG